MAEGFWQFSIEIAIPRILLAMRWTVGLTVLAALLGTFLGLVVALMRISRSRMLRAVGLSYVTVLRGTPLLLQLFFVYFGLPLLDTRLALEPFPAAVIAMGFNSGAYVAEIVRAAIQSIDRGQMEAARSLGLSYGQAMRYVIIPQTYRRLIPPMVNEIIMLSKDTAQAMTISLQEVMRVGQSLVNRFARLEPFLWMGLAYLLITLFLTWISSHYERVLEARE